MKSLLAIFPIFCLTTLLASGVPLPGSADGEQAIEPARKRIVLPELGISVQVPREWSSKQVSSTAVLLISPDKQLWPVEIVSWTTPAPTRTLEQAASGHEKLLAERWQYQRQTLKPFTTAVGRAALAVTGTITTDEGARYTALFAVYVLPDGYLVVGTFCRPEDEHSVTANIFAPLAASIGPPASSPPASPPAMPEPVGAPQTDRPPSTPAPRQPGQPVAPPAPATPQALPQPDQPGIPAQPLLPLTRPQTDRAPSVPLPSQPGQSARPPAPPAPEVPLEPDQPGIQVQPPAPRPPEPTPDEWSERAFSESLMIELPPGWTTALTGGLFHACNPRRCEGLLVCPLYALPADGADQATPGVGTQTVLAHCEDLLGTALTVDREQHLQRGETAFDVVTGSMLISGEQVRATVAVARCEGVILLTGAYAAPAEFDQALPRLGRLLAGMALARLTPTVPELLSNETVPWTSPDGRLTAQLPAGWSARGAVTEYNGHTAISLEGQFAGPPRLRFTWRQPHTPFFRELTPLLRGLNQLPGQPYHERPDESPLLIMSKLPATQLVMRHLIGDIAPHLQNVQIKRQTAYDLAGGLVQGTGRAGTIVQLQGRSLAGPVAATYLLGTADLPITEGSFRWHTGYLAWSGVSGLQWGARLALDTVVHTARAGGDRGDAESLASLIEAARGVLPAAGALSRPKLVPLLSAAFRPQAAGEIRLPASLVSYWQTSPAVPGPMQ